jgi:hypothetical protein
MGFQEIGWAFCLDWIGLMWFRADKCQAVVNMIMNLLGSMKCEEFLNRLRNHYFLEKDSAPSS